MTDPEELVSDFVKSAPKRICTCQLGPDRDGVDRAIQCFYKLKVTQETSQTWSDFHKYVLVERLSYPRSVHAMRDHTRKCLDLA